MTLLFMDGFDVGDFALKWFNTVHSGNVPVIDTTTPFGHGRSLEIPADTSSVFGEVFTNLKRAVPTPAATLICGFNFRWSGANNGNMALLSLYTDAGATIHVQLILRSDGTLDLYRRNGSLTSFSGSATWLASGPASAMLAGVWYFIEVKASIGSSGTVVVRVDEEEVINFTGDTQNGGTGTNIDALALNQTLSPPDGYNPTPTLRFDDLFVCDTLGSVNNDFLGVSRVQTLLPDGGGASTGLTPTPAGPNWDNVNDVPYDTATYNASAVSGTRDTYTLDDLDADTASVMGIQTVLIGEADDATAHVKAALRSGGTVYYDATVAMDGTPSEVSIVVREDDPATSAAWTVAHVNALEAGMEVA